MKKLDNVVQKNGFIYTLVKRNEKAAIYRQEDKEGELQGYEVFRIKTVKDKEVFGNHIEAHEKFPANKDFGITAWSTGKDIKKAYLKFDQL